MPTPKEPSTYWTVDEKGEKTAIFWVNFGPNNREPIKIKINHYGGRIYVDIRYYYFCYKTKVWMPKKSGVNFNMDDWETFDMMFGDIRKAVHIMKGEFVADRAPMAAYMEGENTSAYTPMVETVIEVVERDDTPTCSKRNTNAGPVTTHGKRGKFNDK